MTTRKVTFHEVMRWSDEDCRAFLEAMRWPDGPVCPKCGGIDPYRITRKNPGKNVQRSLYRCRVCKKQYTATVGTIFEDSKIPLHKWFAAIYLMCASKKGISAHQIHRQLKITYKSAWFLCHRIREAMRDKDINLLTGTIEADETYVGGKRRGHVVWAERRQDEVHMGLRPKQPHPRMDKTAVFGMLERGGIARTMVVKDVNRDTLEALLLAGIDTENSRLMTDGHAAYKVIKKHLPHEVINHEETYVRGEVHTQGIENYWSLLKRGLIGVFHHVDAYYLPMYLEEFEYRFNRRRISDEERFAELFEQVQGRLTWYCRSPLSPNPFA